MKLEKTFVLYPFSDGAIGIYGCNLNSQAIYDPATHAFIKRFRDSSIEHYVEPILNEIVFICKGREAGKAVGIDCYDRGIQILENVREITFSGITEFFSGKRFIGSAQ